MAIVRQLGRYLNGDRWATEKKMGARAQTEDPSFHTQRITISNKVCRGL